MCSFVWLHDCECLRLADGGEERRQDDESGEDQERENGAEGLIGEGEKEAVKGRGFHGHLGEGLRGLGFLKNGGTVRTKRELRKPLIAELVRLAAHNSNGFLYFKVDSGGLVEARGLNCGDVAFFGDGVCFHIVGRFGVGYIRTWAK